MASFEKVLADARSELKGEPAPSDPLIGSKFTMVLPEWTRPMMTAMDGPTVSMDTVLSGWVRAKQPRQNTVAEMKRAVRLFETINGSKSITSYREEHARVWRDHIVGWEERAWETKAKLFGGVRSLFKRAYRDGTLKSDPFARVVLERPNRPKINRREEWSRDDLRKLFSSPVFTEGKRSKMGGGEACFWLPVLALFHGSRAGELCQLGRSDVIQREGVWCLAIRPGDSDEGEKTVKTVGSERIVPLHRDVLALGFLDYWRTLTGSQLFPMVRPDYRGRWSGYYTKWFARYRRSIGLDERWKDFHSFRHGWKSAARAAGIAEELHDAITGHDDGSVSRGYGRVPIKELKRALDRVHFDVSIPKWKGSKRAKPV
jgi:integrase